MSAMKRLLEETGLLDNWDFKCAECEHVLLTDKGMDCKNENCKYRNISKWFSCISSAKEV